MPTSFSDAWISLPGQERRTAHHQKPTFLGKLRHQYSKANAGEVPSPVAKTKVRNKAYRPCASLNPKRGDS